MAYIVEITDIHAPELDVYARLTEAQLRSRRDPEKAIFIAESDKVIGHALDAGYRPLSLLMERRQIDPLWETLIARCGDIPVYTASREVLSQLTGYALTRGILCAMHRPALPAPETVLEGAQRIAVLEGIVDPANVGAIFRSAAALHMDGLLLSPTCCDPFHRRAVRVSMGTVFQIPWCYLGSRPDQWPEQGMAFLNEKGFQTASMALSDCALSIDAPELMQVPKLAIILGTEGDGLLPKTIAMSDYTVKIPMAHGVDSLNVAAASAVAFWQLRARNT